METTQRKPPSKMTIAELREEIESLNRSLGSTIPTEGKKAELVERVERIRAFTEPAFAQRKVVASPSGDVASSSTTTYGDGAETIEGTVVEEETAEVPPEFADEVGEAIALREKVVAPAFALPSPQEFNAAQSVALAIASSRVVPEAYRGRPDDVLAAVLYGREIGLGPMTALRDVYMIEGRPALSAHRQLGLLRRGGVVILESEATMERGWIRAQRTDTGEIMEVEFTFEEASKVSGKNGKMLVDGAGWRNYRPDMLWARTVGRLTRRLGPDLIGGLPPYVAEEVADFEGWGVEYGAEGQVRVGPIAAQRAQQKEVDEYRQEFPAYNWPENWPELLDRLGTLIGTPAMVEWVKQATKVAYGKESPRDLSQALRMLMFRKVSGALATLDSAEDSGDLIFDPNLRKLVAEAFASRLDGTLLEGPPWRLSPTEEDRPTYEEYLASLPPEPAAPATDGDVEHERLKERENQAAAEAEAGLGEIIEDAEIVSFEPTEEELAEAEAIPFGDDPSGYGG